ncbi:hypothetical protein [Nocardia salmonicida]|uniref:hypothetical protein n=1 Tax=Nocardia salmonicida TaxID=53431 RepID=UPI00363DF2EA
MAESGAIPLAYSPPVSAVNTARAFPNIALIKYWGKADLELHILTTSSVSLTLGICPTATAGRIATKSLDQDKVFLAGQPADSEFSDRVARLLDLSREKADSDCRAVIHTVNHKPIAVRAWRRHRIEPLDLYPCFQTIEVNP